MPSFSPARPPTEVAELGGVHQLARHTIGLAQIVCDRAAKTDDVANDFRQVKNRDVLARTDIDLPVRRIGLREMNDGVGAIIDMQELAPRRTRSPDGQ